MPSVVMLNAVKLNAFVLSVVMPNAVMLNVNVVSVAALKFNQL
jgi:hypothetical protein